MLKKSYDKHMRYFALMRSQELDTSLPVGYVYIIIISRVIHLSDYRWFLQIVGSSHGK